MAGKSVASLSSETAPRAWAKERAKVFLSLFLDDKAFSRKSVPIGIALVDLEAYLSKMSSDVIVDLAGVRC